MVKSVVDFLNEINIIRNKKHFRYKTLFFRGVSNKSYDLHPSIYRTRNDERLILDEFMRKSVSHDIKHNEFEPINWLVDMQHYGIPTRLLDWSLSPLVALYFAVNNRAEADAKVYILNPKLLATFSREKPESKPSNQNSKHVLARSLLIKRTEKYLLSLKRFNNIKDLEYPIPFFPNFSNNRLIAQGGCFTIHGEIDEPINHITKKRNLKNGISIGKDNFLIEIIIPYEYKQNILEELWNLNINPHTLFPDIYGLSEKITAEGRFGLDK